MDQEVLSQKTLKNFSFSFVGYILPIVFAISITPIIIHRLGASVYGVYLLINTIMGFLGLTDLGVGLAVVKYAAEYAGAGDTASLRKLLDSARSILLIIGILGLLVFAVLGKFFPAVFHLQNLSSSYVFLVFIYGGLLFLLGSISSVYLYVPKAMQRYDLIVEISLFQIGGSSLLGLLVVLMGYGLQALLLVNLVVSLVAFLFYFIAAKKILPSLTFSFGWDREQIKKCYRFGLQAFVTNISNNTLAQFDRLIIPIYLNPAQLSYYSLPGNVAEKINGVTGSTTSVLFPMISGLKGQGDAAKIETVYIKVFRNIFVLAAAMTVPIIFFADKILYFWLGADFAKNGGKVLILLALTNLVLSLYSVLQNFLSGYGKMKFLMKCSVFMAGLNVAMLLVLVPKWGIVGAAWAYLIAVLPIIWIFYWVEKHFLLFKSRGAFYWKLILKLSATSAVAGVVYFFLRSLVSSIWALVTIGPLSVLLFLGLYAVLGFAEKEDIQVVRDFFNLAVKKMFGRFTPGKSSVE